jgi:hypothetical protein
MDQNTLVDPRIKAGAEFLIKLQQKFTLLGAFWLEAPGATGADLLVVAKEITDENIDVGYGEVLRIAQEMNNPWLDVFQVKLVDARDPLVQDVMKVYDRYPGGVPTRFPPTTRGAGEERIYVYPIPVPDPSLF